MEIIINYNKCFFTHIFIKQSGDKVTSQY